MTLHLRLFVGQFVVFYFKAGWRRKSIAFVKKDRYTAAKRLVFVRHVMIAQSYSKGTKHQRLLLHVSRKPLVFTVV